jgi:hypothetical protein
MTLEIIDKAAIRNISNEALEALKEVGEKHGVVFSKSNSVYSNGNSGKIAFELVIGDANETPEELARRLLEDEIKNGTTNFTLDDIGTIFKQSPNGRKRYKFIGLDVNGKVVAIDLKEGTTTTFVRGFTPSVMASLKV